MNSKKRIVLIGATSAIAEHCARIWVEREPVDLTLVGRSTERTNRVANDLKVRCPESELHVIQSDFLDPAAIDNIVSDVYGAGSIDIILIAHGMLPEQSECQDDTLRFKDTLEVNGLSPVLFAEAFAREMIQADYGTLALIGSVAGDRGRKSNYAYGAGKALVERYAQGLQHRISRTRVRVILIKPGPTDTPMTSALKASGASLTAVETVSKQIVKGIDRGQAVIYTPKKWWWIMMVVRYLPSFIFNRLNI